MTKLEEEQYKLYSSMLPEELDKLRTWKYSEIEPYYVCTSIDLYRKLMNLPRDFTIIDLGCNQACQVIYYEDFSGYIGVDNSVPVENRLHRNNTIHYQMDYKEFLNNILPQLLSEKIIDLDKTIAVSYLMPGIDFTLIKEKFKYFDIYYPGYNQNSSLFPQEVYNKGITR